MYAILRGRPNGRFADLLAFETLRAGARYTDARRGLPALSPAGRLTALAGNELYASILSRIEEMNYDVLDTRAHVSTRHQPAAVLTGSPAPRAPSLDWCRARQAAGVAMGVAAGKWSGKRRRAMPMKRPSAVPPSVAARLVTTTMVEPVSGSYTIHKL